MFGERNVIPIADLRHQLAQPAKGFDLPNAKTVADPAAFLALNDAYHVGEMGYARKGLGDLGLLV